MSGFARQRLCVVPRPTADAALTQPTTRRLLVTDAGWFGAASQHLRRRPEGSEEAIVILCAAGSGWVDIAGRRMRMGPSTAVVIPPRTPHAYGASEDDPWTIWWCHLRGSDMGDLVETATSPDRALLSLQSLDRAVALFDEMITQLELGPSRPHLIAAAGVAWRLMTQLATDRDRSDTELPLGRAMRFLEERVEAVVRVDDLARWVGVSASHLGALFRAATGGGVQQYHAGLKLARARHLLDTTELRIAEVARTVGYTDPLYFSKLFARAHGCSPSRYREQPKG